MECPLSSPDFAEDVNVWETKYPEIEPFHPRVWREIHHDPQINMGPASPVEIPTPLGTTSAPFSSPGCWGCGCTECLWFEDRRLSSPAVAEDRPYHAQVSIS